MRIKKIKTVIIESNSLFFIFEYINKVKNLFKGDLFPN